MKYPLLGAVGAALLEAASMDGLHPMLRVGLAFAGGACQGELALDLAQGFRKLKRGSDKPGKDHATGSFGDGYGTAFGPCRWSTQMSFGF